MLSAPQIPTDSSSLPEKMEDYSPCHLQTWVLGWQGHHAHVPTRPVLSHEPLVPDSAPPHILQTGNLLFRGTNMHLAGHLLGGLAQR